MYDVDTSSACAIQMIVYENLITTFDRRVRNIFRVCMLYVYYKYLTLFIYNLRRCTYIIEYVMTSSRYNLSQEKHSAKLRVRLFWKNIFFLVQLKNW